MRRIVLGLGAVYLLLIGIGVARAADNEIKIAESTEVGKYLTDSEGKTLYWYKKDAPGKFACNSTCLDQWLVYYREDIVPPTGILKSDFGTIIREDGEKQTTFRGYPLYYSINDQEPGDINRQKGNHVVGLVIDPSAFPPKKKDDKAAKGK